MDRVRAAETEDGAREAEGSIALRAEIENEGEEHQRDVEALLIEPAS